MFSLSKGKYTGEIARSLDVDDNIITNTRYFNNESSCDWHFHENPHISFMIEGGDAESRRSRSYRREAGSISFFHAGEEHRNVVGNNVSKNINIEFGRSLFKKFNFSEAQIDGAVTNNLDAKFLVLKMQQEMLFNDGDSALAIQTLLLDLVSHSKNIYHGTVPNWVLVLTDLLHERWNEKLTLSELSDATDVHPTTISKHFRKYFYCTLGEYLRKLKINQSISLIKTSDYNLTEIAFQCGFADQSHFTRTFKQFTGFLPRNFRKI